MNMRLCSVACLLALGAVAITSAGAGAAPNGKELFENTCAMCHPDGGNTINEEKTLKGTALKKNGITGKADIIKLMRNPGPGMAQFDEATLPQQDAEAIAEYVLTTFK